MKKIKKNKIRKIRVPVYELFDRVTGPHKNKKRYNRKSKHNKRDTE